MSSKMISCPGISLECNWPWHLISWLASSVAEIYPGFVCGGHCNCLTGGLEEMGQVGLMLLSTFYVIFVRKLLDTILTIIGSDNGLLPGWRQAIIWTNAGILLRTLGINFNEMLIEILTFSFMKMSLKVSSAKWRPFCLGFNVLNASWF